jgi:hypothetical protein
MPLDVVENYFHESVIFFFKFLKNLLRNSLQSIVLYKEKIIGKIERGP